MIIVSYQIRVHEDEREKILKRSEVEREAADDEQHRAETYLVRKNISNWLPFFKKMGHSRPLFRYFRLFNTVDRLQICSK